MVFAIGTKVKLVHTGDLAVVTHWLDGGMIQVRIVGEDMEIPVFPEDIARVQDEAPTVKAKVVPGKQEKPPAEPPRPQPAIQYTILKSQGIQLAFEPMFRNDGVTEKYIVHLINDTRQEALYDYELSIANGVLHTDNGKLNSLSVVKVGELLYDQLNDAPVFDIECRLITTEGVGEVIHKNLKIKAKSFFTKIKTAPLLNRKVHLFRLFEDLQSEATKVRSNEDLATYTRRYVAPAVSRLDAPVERHEVVELAEFQPEIDLHIEKLVSNFAKLNNAEILSIQLTHFEQYIERAIQMGVERVFVIHGVGAGRLRSSIATQLMQMQHVKTFKNEYHPRYGYGATEVIFE
ncbi:MAG TPA: Smr/MutS family protein [Saprospiraceae bacterium]|nr:Smr/MutS family protein [Saprospiraceae bacterium]HMP24485.1 Smr/MutS family protein [Saprospiraceae bacterium]